MASQTSARRRTLIALVVCAAVAVIFSLAWVTSIYPSFCGGAYADFKFYPHVLFLPASVVAFVLNASDAGLRKALFCEAFLISFMAVFIIYCFFTYALRGDND
jgi:uncharacterized membrane protein